MDARASDAPAVVALEWVAPPGCPSAAYIERRTRTLVGDVGVSSGPLVVARAEVREEMPGVWHVEIQTQGPEGPGLRAITAESCRAAADAAALVLALTIHPKPAEANPKTSPAPDLAPPLTVPSLPIAGPPAPAANAPVHPPPSVPEVRGRGSEGAGTPSPTPRALRWAFEPLATLDVGTLPAAAEGLGARLALIPGALPALRLELGAALFLDESTRNPPARSATFSLRTFDAGGCLVARAGRLEGGGCTGIEVDWLSAAGLDESMTAGGDAEWVVIRVRATGAYALSNAWAIRADAGAGLDLARPQFVSEGVGQGLIDRPARFTGRAGLGIELHF